MDFGKLSDKQTDLWANCQGKLNYELGKAQLELWKNQALKQQRYELEAALQDLKLRYQNYLELLSCTVFQDCYGRLVYAITDKDGGNIASKPLLNVSGFKAVRYYSCYPELRAFLRISWQDCERGGIYFRETPERISPQHFLKCLKSSGIMFLVSGRTERKAADALLAYAISTAEQKEIPFFRGWNLMSDGRWHFAHDNELTIREVEEHAF